MSSSPRASRWRDRSAHYGLRASHAGAIVRLIRGCGCARWHKFDRLAAARIETHPEQATQGVGITGCTENRSPVHSHRITPPIPPEDSEQQQGVIVDTTERVDTAEMEHRADLDQDDDAAEKLANAFYGGLGAGPDGVTAAIRRRDMAIARQLVAAGATAAQAEAYAREASAASGRIAPVDLRRFERERLGWLARRRGGDVSQRHVVDRSGQPPSWRTAQSEQEPTAVVANSAEPQVPATAPDP